MFKCGNCKQDTQHRQPVNYVVMVKRAKVYETKYDRGDWKTTEGYETVEEIKACPSCFNKLTGLKPKIAEPRQEVKTEKEPERPRFKPSKNFNKLRIDKTNPNWKYKKDLDEIRRREAGSADPRGNVERKKPFVEVINRLPKKH